MTPAWLIVGSVGAAAAWASIALWGLLVRRAFQNRRDLLARLQTLVPDRPRELLSDPMLHEAEALLHAVPHSTVARLLTESPLPPSIEALCCVRLLEGAGEQTLAAAARRCRTPRQRRRQRQALHVLTIGKSPLAIDLVASVLENVDDQMVRTLAGTLGRVADRRAALLLLTLLRRPGPYGTRIAACLDAFPDDLADLLVPLAADDDPILRSWAGVLLRRYAQRVDVSNLLAQLADDPDPRVRRSALGSLADIGGPQALQTAQQRLTDPVADIRARAARALGTIGALGSAWRIALLLGDREWEVRTAACDALFGLGPEVTLVLSRALASDDQFVREGAAAVIARLSADSAPAVLVATEWTLEAFSPDAVLPESGVLA